LSTKDKQLKYIALKANNLASEYQYREALELSDRLLELGGHDKQHYLYRAIWQHKIGKDRDALRSIESAFNYGLTELSGKVLFAKLLLANKRSIDCSRVCDDLFEKSPPVFGFLKGLALKQAGKSDEAILWLIHILKRDDCQTTQIVDLFLRLAAVPLNGLDYILPMAKSLSEKIPMFNAIGNQYLWYQDAQKKSILKVLESKNPRPAVTKTIQSLYLLSDEEHKELWRWHCLAANALCEQKKLTLEKRLGQDKLRIGFVSSDLRNHSVAYFLIALYENIDREKYEIFSYYTNEKVDTTTYVFEELSTRFYFAGTMPDDELIRTIKADGVDVLVDLNGYSSNHRLSIFSKRAAPIQVSWLGYPYTTAVSNMDFRIVDLDTDPLDTKEFYSETLVRLDRPFISYKPIADVEIKAENFDASVTFGCFNNLSKINLETLEIWSALLIQVKNSRLVIKASGLHSLMIQSRLRKFFMEKGIERSRVIILQRRADQIEHLKDYNKVDLALDTYPYGGTTTTCEALYMGVPVATIVGNSHRSRVTYSILKSVGLEKFSFPKKDFVIKVKELCAQTAELRKNKINLRKNFLSSPICDGKDFTDAWIEAIEKLAR